MARQKVLWLIPARCGSKGIPNKNIKELGEIPLLAHRIQSTLEVAEKENIWVSTDSEKYADLAEEYGATVPFIRPASLGSDEASSSDVVLHAMSYAESLGLCYDLIGLLEPTSPFVKSVSLMEAVSLLYKNGVAKSIIAVRESKPSTIYIQEEAVFLDIISEKISKMNSTRRQDTKKEITPSGGFYISKWDEFKKIKTFYSAYTMGFEVGKLEELEIDEPIDFLWAEFLLKYKIHDRT